MRLRRPVGELRLLGVLRPDERRRVSLPHIGGGAGGKTQVGPPPLFPLLQGLGFSFLIFFRFVVKSFCPHLDLHFSVGD